MVFNVLAINCDDHVKNTAFLMDRTGKWRLSPAGLLLIIGFCIIVIIAVIFDNSVSKKFDAKFKEENPIKANHKNMSITENGKLVFYLPSGKLAGYKVWNLDEVGYISISKTRFRQISLVRISIMHC